MFSNKLITTIFLPTLLCTLTEFRASSPDHKTAKSSQVVPVDSIDRDSQNPRPDSLETSRYSEYGISQEIFNEYKALNEKEIRYVEYKDSDSMLVVKLLQLNYINKSRVEHSVQPVRLDILASRVANRISKEACEQGFEGHWNTRGEKPYHRYAFAGGLDHISENVYAMWTSGILEHSTENYADFMHRGHDGFTAEKAPHDGHKRNCIDPHHNFVGIGCYMTSHPFRYYEEFIDRYIDFIDVEKKVNAGQEFSITLKPITPAKHVCAVIVYYEPFPEPMTPAQINETASYPDFTSDVELSLGPWDINVEQETGNCTIPMKFSRRGLYYVHIYLSDKEHRGSEFTTESKIQASGLVISAFD
jgi:uncharacterized protein YkwD